MKQKTTKTTMIKSGAFNQIRRFFNSKEKELASLSPEEKEECICQICKETNDLLFNYKQKRKRKAGVQKMREQAKVNSFLQSHPDLTTTVQSLNGTASKFVQFFEKLEKESVH